MSPTWALRLALGSHPAATGWQNQAVCFCKHLGDEDSRTAALQTRARGCVLPVAVPRATALPDGPVAPDPSPRPAHGP